MRTANNTPADTTSDPDTPSRSVEGHENAAEYAYARSRLAVHDPVTTDTGGTQRRHEYQYAIEPHPGAAPHRDGIHDLAGAIDALPNYRAGATVIVRDVTYGPWRYVTPEQIDANVRGRGGDLKGPRPPRQEPHPTQADLDAVLKNYAA